MEYRIEGGSLPVVLCQLQAGESVINESGSMVWMTSNMKMETIGGGASKMLGRLLSGDTMFQNAFTAEGGPGEIAFAPSVPGTIVPIEVTPDRPVVLQKSAFLAATRGVELSVFFNKKLGAGLFGGEGFIMQKVTGSGIVFVEIDGHAVEYTLAAGQSMIVDTGNLAIMDHTCTMDIQKVPGVKNMFFGGEGVFNTLVTGPGKITVQSMPVSSLADALRPFFPSNK